jgi:uncharacterized RDD family membrane protein YckC
MFCSSCGTTLRDGATFCPNCGTAQTPAALPGTPPPVYGYAPPPVAPPYPAMPVAQWPDRALGYIIDSLIVLVVMAGIYAVAGGLFAGTVASFGKHGNPEAFQGMCCMIMLVSFLASLLVGFINRAYLVSTRGYSVGQGVMKLKVVDANGNLLKLSTAFFRLLVQIGLGFVPLGSVLDLLWPLWDDRRQTLHDKVVGSFVIKVG